VNARHCNRRDRDRDRDRGCGYGCGHDLRHEHVFPAHRGDASGPSSQHLQHLCSRSSVLKMCECADSCARGRARERSGARGREWPSSDDRFAGAWDSLVVSSWPAFVKARSREVEDDAVGERGNGTRSGQIIYDLVQKGEGVANARVMSSRRDDSSRSAVLVVVVVVVEVEGGGVAAGIPAWPGKKSRRDRNAQWRRRGRFDILSPRTVIRNGLDSLDWQLAVVCASAVNEKQ
jgi:hypothetical protein